MTSVGFDLLEGPAAAQAIALENKGPLALDEGLVGNWLPESDAHQNVFPLLYEFPFGILNVRKGKKSILPDDEYQAARQARVRLPKVPAARTWLESAIQWKKRLQADPNLTRAALAQEVGISPTRITHILNLLKLAPDIRRVILRLPAALRRCFISEPRLRKISRLESHKQQLAAFRSLVPNIERALT